jgi:uncharacterized membrane protein YdjX (TVP38/TMEM64 family)
MPLDRSSSCATGRPASRLRRFVPLAVIALATIAVFATGAHRHVSLETLVRHRMAIDGFIDAHAAVALLAFMAVYIVVVALSIPGAALLTIAGGILFGTFVGGSATVIAATIGATIIFLVAKSACGENLARHAGPLAGKLSEGFRADAFSYLLFLRLVPAFPFFLVNLVPALAGVKLTTFVAATVIGIIPATFAFAFFGSGLDSVIVTQEVAYRACVASGRADCALQFDLGMIATPKLLAAFAAMGVIALIPVAVKRLRARSGAARSAPDEVTP